MDNPVVYTIDFFFNICGQLWSLVLGYWFLCASFLIGLLGLIISLVNESRQDG